METLRAHELVAGVLVVLVTAVLIIKQRRRLTWASSLPRPRGFPVIGNLHQLGALPHKSLAELSSSLGAPLMLLRLGSVPTLVVSTADALRAAFQPNDRATSGRPATYAAARITYGAQDIVMSHPDGAFGRAARRASVSEVLGAPRVRGFRGVREGEAAALVAAVADAASAGPVNLSHMFTATSNRIVRRVAFGVDAGDESSIDARVLDETEYLLGAFFVADYIPWLGWVDALRGLRRRLERNFQELDAFYERVIEDRVRQGEVSKERDLVDVLLRLHRDPAQGLTLSQMKGILTDMFIAGTDTSAATVEWTMTELLRHPDVLAKAQHEVRRVVAGKDMVREADLPGLTYLKQVIREAMRLHPAIPVFWRETIAPCTVRGCEIPVGTRLLINAQAVGVDPAAWGADAARFVPERHEEVADLTDRRLWHDDSFALVPFGVGRRRCPGVHFGTAVAELVLANLLLCFDWTAPLGEEVDVEEAAGNSVHRKNPLMVVAHRRCVQ